ncbi:hypothetical protein [Riemerella columbipharyngis]|uniref:Uncharacterized protein n=1 Tax=Riemerella columbipharyngis TaxID=1071918 RepID=A0A1G6YCJ9_9FLAO|nr:hypothetical protein [Riemerella columbipharyngis]SDD88052.1 hypothetical protein SAMN05421544_101111 [Riemerella columbipharyngis]
MVAKSWGKMPQLLAISMKDLPKTMKFLALAAKILAPKPKILPMAPKNFDT